ncbi:MAG: ABC transporter permease subunit [Firmicutes bacterium]|nr:ABC transporter permease subunit [Bacillota bacterium]
MLAEFKQTLRRLRGQIIGWAVGVGIYGFLMSFFYPSMVEMGDMTEDFIALFPEAVLAFFENIYFISTPMGYLDVYYFSYMHLIIGILAVSAGAGLLAADEEKGVLDLVLAHPVSRSGLFFGRLLALATALIFILTVSWLSWVLPSGSVELVLNPVELLRPFLPLLGVLFLFAATALFLSMVLPAARQAGMLTGALLVGNYLLLGLSNISDELEPVVKYTPLYYYQGGTAVDGLNGNWLAGLLAAALLLAAAAWLLFLRRDIRVGGERSWNLPSLSRRRSS